MIKKEREIEFSKFPRVGIFKDEYCRCQGRVRGKNWTHSYEKRLTKSGVWCRKCWVDCKICITVGCDEPRLDTRDCGDGTHCRACLMFD